MMPLKLFCLTSLIIYCFFKPAEAVNNVYSFRNYSKDTLNRKVINRFPNGKKQSIYRLKNGVIDGKIKVFYTSGKLKSLTLYRNGVPYGECKTFYPSGKLESKFGVDSLGQPIGEYTCYYENGKLKIKSSYANVNGKLVECADSLDGICSSVKNIRDMSLISNTLVGKWHEYYESGRPKVVGEYANYYFLFEEHQPQGEFLVTYSTYSPVKNGIWTYYDSLGNTVREEVWNAGNLVNQ